MSAYTLRDVRVAVEARMKAAAPTVNILRDPEDRAPVDPDGRVHPYVVHYFAAPYEDELEASACGARDLDHVEWQTTCVGGDQDRCEHAITRTLAALRGWQPLPGSGVVRTVVGGAPVTKDSTVTPPRYYAPVIFRVDLP